MDIKALAEKAMKRDLSDIGAMNDAFDTLVELGAEDFTEAHRLNKELRRLAGRYAKEQDSEEFMGVYKKSLLFDAPWEFDAYMRYTEWGREPKARFWMPRRKILEGRFKIATQIDEFINDDSLFLGICAPPGIGKSTLIKFLLSFIFGKFPKSANMYVSYADGMVKMMYDSVRSIITDKNEYKFADVFPDAANPKCSAEYSTISCRNDGDFPTLGLVSLGGSVTGRTRANKFLVTDDLVKNSEMARSPDRLEKLNADYKSTLTTRMIGDDVKQIMLGTVWSYYDPISDMRRKHEDDPRYKFIILPVCDEAGHSNFEYDHPDNYTDKKIADIKATIDPVDFSCLYLQQGIQKEGLAFPADFLQTYNGVLPEGEPDNILFYCDVAFGGGDYLSMPIFYIYGEDVYIPDVIYDKGFKTVTQPRVVGKILRHKIRMGRFEANNGGELYRDDISDALKKAGYSINLTAKKAPSTQSKMSRIEQHVTTIRGFYFLDEKLRDDDYRRFMNDLTMFSFTGENKHDDAPDSLAGFCDYRNMGLSKAEIFKRPF